MRRPAELFKNPLRRARFHGPVPATWGKGYGPGRVLAALRGRLARSCGEDRAKRGVHDIGMSLPSGPRYRWMSPGKGAGPMITAASGVAVPGRSTAGSIFLLELGHIDLIGEGINVVMLTGAFHRPDTNRVSRCARRSDDTEADRFEVASVDPTEARKNMADDPVINPALSLELSKDRITLPRADDLADVTLGRFLDAVRAAVAAKDGWLVSDSIVLSCFPPAALYVI